MEPAGEPFKETSIWLFGTIPFAIRKDISIFAAVTSLVGVIPNDNAEGVRSPFKSIPLLFPIAPNCQVSWNEGPTPALFSVASARVFTDCARAPGARAPQLATNVT